MRVPAMRTLENALRRVGFCHVAGVDEVGRGCLAGPVVAAAVILHPDKHIPGVCDSKLVPAAVLATAGVRFALGGLHQLTGNEGWEDVAGYALNWCNEHSGRGILSTA